MFILSILDGEENLKNRDANFMPLVKGFSKSPNPPFLKGGVGGYPTMHLTHLTVHWAIFADSGFPEECSIYLQAEGFDLKEDSEMDY